MNPTSTFNVICQAVNNFMRQKLIAQNTDSHLSFIKKVKIIKRSKESLLA